MAGFANDISEQEYYGSFPTTSKATAVSRKVGIRKITATRTLNAMGPSGEDRDEDIVERVIAQNISPTQAGLTPSQMALYNKNAGQQGSGGGTSNSASTDNSSASTSAATPPKMPSNTMIYILGGAAILLGVLVYRKFRK